MEFIPRSKVTKKAKPAKVSILSLKKSKPIKKITKPELTDTVKANPEKKRNFVSIDDGNKGGVRKYGRGNSFNKFVTVPITIAGKKEDVSLRIVITGVPFEMRNNIHLFAGQTEFKDTTIQKQAKVDKEAKVEEQLDRKLYVNMKKVIESEEEVKALHPDIISVVLPKRVKKRWCFILFENKQKAVQALKVLRKQGLTAKPATLHTDKEKRTTKTPDKTKALKSWL